MGSSPAAPTNALQSFEVEAGFRLELVAAEPAIASPVALAFDENGRLFVLEMGDSPGAAGPSRRSGRVRLLEDTDGKGVYGASKVYADDLPQPSALACYGGGLFVAAALDILYLKDTQGNGFADARKVVFSGFASNALDDRARLNNFQWGLDNRIHGLTGGTGGVITAPGVPGAGPVSLSGSDFSFDPRALSISPEAGPAQSGLAFDSRGRRFVSDFVRPLRLAMYDRRYFARNQFFARPQEFLDVASPATPIFQSVPGAKRLAAAWLTDARGCAIYRGSAFPSAYFENVFIADAKAHVIHRAVLQDNGLECFAARPANESRTEFLVSHDASFRPRQIVNGPDGAMYIADERDGHDTGRIYRIVPNTYRRAKLPQLGKAKTYDLVASLAHTNGWWRDTAARLLYERREPTAAGLLTNMLQNSRLALTRLQALHALDGLDALNEAQVLKAMQDGDERVREHSVLLAEKLIGNGTVSDLLWDQLKGLTGDPAIRVRYQLAFTLGEIQRPEKAGLLAAMLAREMENSWLRAAAQSSLATGAAKTLVRLAGDVQLRRDPAAPELLEQLATMIGLLGEPAELKEAMDFLDQTALEPQQTFALLAALGEGLHRAMSSLASVDPQGQLQRFYRQAQFGALAASAAEPLRLAAIRLLGVSPLTFGDVGDILLLPLGSDPSQALQSASIAALGRFDEPGLATSLIQRWPTLTPAMRKRAATALLARNSRIADVLSALENGKIASADLSPAQINFLRTYRDSNLSQRASQIFGPLTLARPETVERFRPALRLAGTAANGREIFLARCSQCHRLGGEGQQLGPDLTGAKINGKEALLKAVIEPNASLRPGYETYVLETKEGEVLIGVKADDNLTAITLAQPQGIRSVWPRASLEFIQKQSWSLMPEGLEDGLAPQDMADLLECLLAAQ